MREAGAGRRPFRERWTGAVGERGQVLILTAAGITLLLGVAALSVDASYMYDKRNRLHAAADAAARTAAIELLRNPGASNADLVAFAEQQVTAHFLNPPSPTLVEINIPPVVGLLSSGSGGVTWIEAVVTEENSTFFGNVLGMLSMTPRAWAVAGIAASNDCLLALEPTATSTIGAASVTPDCDAAIGGDLNLDNPTAQVNGSAGDCYGRGDCSQVNEGIPPPLDPLAGTLTPPSDPGCPLSPVPPTGCDIDVPNNSALTITPGAYEDINVATNSTLTLSAGLYYLTGSFTNGNNSVITGSGVTIYIAPGGQINLGGNNTDISLSAPVGGDYNGILFYQDPSNANDFIINGNSLGANISGVVYVPGAHVELRNGLRAQTDCAIIVTASFEVRNGNGALDSTCSAYGGNLLSTIAFAE